MAHKKRRQAGKSAIEITDDMLAAGIRVYSNPGRYETYEGVVARIYRAMLKARATASATDRPDEGCRSE
jgi:Arc/MetJ family transcription regulator